MIRVLPASLPHQDRPVYALVSPGKGAQDRQVCLSRRPIGHVTTYFGLAGELSPDGEHVVGEEIRLWAGVGWRGPTGSYCEEMEYTSTDRIVRLERR